MSLLISAMLGLSTQAMADELVAARERLDSGCRAKLTTLADRCDAQQLDDLAKQTRSWLPSRPADQLVLFVIDRDTKPTALPENATDSQRKWQEQFEALRAEQADALFKLAQQAAQADRLSLARRWLTETVRENPRHEAARKALGYELVDGEWITSYAARMQRSGNLWHSELGWIRERDQKRYQAGLRKFGTRWIIESEEARLRRHITKGWEINTEHFTVTTNHSQRAGVQLALRLERLWQIWQQLFGDDFTGNSDLKRTLTRIETTRRPSTRRYKPHQVVYYRTKQEYVNALRSAQPRIEITLGIYFDTRRKAYFFAGQEQDSGTIYHEATHQLFHESSRTAKQVGEKSNFWIVEGIATYFESLIEHPGYFTLGGLEAGRVPAARVRLLEDNFYAPFSEITRLSKADLQSHRQIAKLYSQAAGQTTFLMHTQSGRYRQALAHYLRDVYSNRADAGTLSKLADQSYSELDREYREFLKTGR